MNAVHRIKYPLRILRDRTRSYVSDLRTRRRFIARASDIPDFDYFELKRTVGEFLRAVRYPGRTFLGYRYSESATSPTLYGSVYACMTLSLFGEVDAMSEDDKGAWLRLFDSFQSENDGLFYDPVLQSDWFATFDWWGARHLALHMISAYTALGSRPRYPFKFLYRYYDVGSIKTWLDGVQWNKELEYSDDVDNKIMNIGCLLQYQRDAWNDEDAGNAVAYIQQYLAERVNPATGMWGAFEVARSDQRSRIVQFAYHLFPLYFYDHIPIQWPERIIGHVLATQNEFGGFGVKANSSACEDIDSVDILVRLASHVGARKKAEIDAALQKALRWVLFNQVEDGGFVFRLHEPFVYGHKETSSRTNRGAMLPTWFRTLCLAYLTKYLGVPNEFVINRCPGCEF